MERLFLRSVWRDFDNRENGPFNANLDNDLENRKSFGLGRSDLVSNIGARARSSPTGQDIMISGIMSYLKSLQVAYNLVSWVYPTLNKFPKSQRLILSQRIELLALGILTAAIKLNYANSKVTRKNAVVDIHKLQVLFRVSKDLSFLDLKKYEYASRLLSEILKTFSETEKVDENLQKFIREDMQLREPS